MLINQNYNLYKDVFINTICLRTLEIFKKTRVFRSLKSAKYDYYQFIPFNKLLMKHLFEDRECASTMHFPMCKPLIAGLLEIELGLFHENLIVRFSDELTHHTFLLSLAGVETFDASGVLPQKLDLRRTWPALLPIDQLAFHLYPWPGVDRVVSAEIEVIASPYYHLHIYAEWEQDYLQRASVAFSVLDVHLNSTYFTRQLLEQLI
jgi:hypothetical protein